MTNPKEEELSPKDDEKVELTDTDVDGVDGGFKFHQHKVNPTQVPMSQPLNKEE